MVQVDTRKPKKGGTFFETRRGGLLSLASRITKNPNYLRTLSIIQEFGLESKANRKSASNDVLQSFLYPNIIMASC